MEFLSIKKNCKKLFFICLFVFIILGFLLRLKVYLIGRPIWLDEGQLALSLLNRNFLGFFTELERQQSAPPLFLILVKDFTFIFGTKELAMRIVPFVGGLLALPLFYVFSKQFLIRKWSVLLASFLFAVNKELIYYSQEFKQYSTDVLFFMLAFVILNKLSLKNLSVKQTVLYSLFIALLPLLSVPTVFVIGAWFIKELICNKLNNLKKFAVFCFPIGIINIIYLITVIIPQHNVMIKHFEYFWAKGFVTFDLLSDFDILKDNIVFFFDPNFLPLLIIILLFGGILCVLRRIKRSPHIILVLSFILILICSFLHIYPLSKRVALYTVPVLIVLILKPLDYFSLKRKVYSLIISAVLVISFCKYTPAYMLNYPFLLRDHVTNGKILMKKLVKHYNGKGCIMVNNASYSEYSYYAGYYNFKPKCIKTDGFPEHMDYMAHLNNLKDGDYWFFYSFDYQGCPVIPMLKKWAADYEIKYEYEIPGSYLLHLKKRSKNK